MNLGAEASELTRVPAFVDKAKIFIGTRRWVRPALWSVSILATVAVLLAYSTGELSLARAILVLVSPPLLLVAGFRSQWLVISLLALPPGLVGALNYIPLVALMAVALIVQYAFRGRLFLGPRSGLYPIALLAIGSLVFKANVGLVAYESAGDFQKQLLYYLLLGLLSYNLTRTGTLRLAHLISALLIGALSTGVLKLAFGGLGPTGNAQTGEPSQLFLGRDHAYITFIGFSICFSAFILASEDYGRFRRFLPWCFGLGAFFLTLTATSFVRGSWLLVVLAVALVAWMSRRPLYWVLIPLAVVVALSVPVARERLTNVDANTDFTTGRWALWTTVWNEHVTEGLPTGHGFGYAWSLTPDRLFGFSSFVYEGERIVYLHSDLLFWMVEFGLFGLAALLAFWGHTLHAWRRLARESNPYLRTSATLLTGIVLAMLLSTVFGNAFGFRALSERFFVVSGFLLGLRAARIRGDLNVAARTSLSAATD